MTDDGGTDRTPLDRTPGFRVLYEPDPELGGDQGSAEVAFVVEKPRSAYRYDIWTRHGYRKDVSLEIFHAIYKPRSQSIRVPEAAEMAVRDVWRRGGDVSAELGRLHPIMQDPAATAGEGESR